MDNTTIYNSASLIYSISKYLGASPIRLVKKDKTYEIISKPIDVICFLLHLSLAIFIIYLSILEKLGIDELTPNEMTRQGSTYLVRTVIPLNSIAIVVTYFRRQKILKVIEKMDQVDQELVELDSPMDIRSEFEQIQMQMLLAGIVTIVSAGFTYIILKDITDFYLMVAQLMLCYAYNSNYMLFMGHFIGSHEAIKRRFIKLNHGFK